MALAGGVQVDLPLRRGLPVRDRRILSPRRPCRAVRRRRRRHDLRRRRRAWWCSSGWLTRWPPATTIHAVIHGSAINNDGTGKAGFTAPGVDGPDRGDRAALGDGRGRPRDDRAVEAHGTGTRARRPDRGGGADRRCSARTPTDGRLLRARLGRRRNVGHLDTAAGVVGLIKATLAVEHGVIPPTINWRRTRRSTWTRPFRLPTEPEPWHAGRHRRAARRSAPSASAAPTPTSSSAAARSRAAARARLGAPQLVAAVGPLRRRRSPPVARPLASTWRPPAHASPTSRSRCTRATAHPVPPGGGGRSTTEAADAALRATDGPHDAGVTGHREVAFLLPGQGAQHPGRGAGSTRPSRRTGTRSTPAATCLHPCSAWTCGPPARRPDRRRGAAALAQTAVDPAGVVHRGMGVGALWKPGIVPAALLGHSSVSSPPPTSPGSSSWRTRCGWWRPGAG